MFYQDPRQFQICELFSDISLYSVCIEAFEEANLYCVLEPQDITENLTISENVNIPAGKVVSSGILATVMARETKVKAVCEDYLGSRLSGA